MDYLSDDDYFSLADNGISGYYGDYGGFSGFEAPSFDNSQFYTPDWTFEAPNYDWNTDFTALAPSYGDFLVSQGLGQGYGGFDPTNFTDLTGAAFNFGDPSTQLDLGGGLSLENLQDFGGNQITPDAMTLSDAGITNYDGMMMTDDGRILDTPEAIAAEVSRNSGAMDPLEYMGLRSSATGPGLKGGIVHDLGGGLGTLADAERLRTGALDERGMLGKGLDGNAGYGALIEGAPTAASDLSSIKLLGDEGTLADWSGNKDLSWADYAKKQGLYDPYDIGTDLRWSWGNAMPSAGYGGMGGKGTTLNPEALAKAAKAADTSAGKGSATEEKKKDKEYGAMNAGMDAAKMAALIAGILAKGQGREAKRGHDIGSRGMKWAQNLAHGGLLQMARGGRPRGGQDDVIPIMGAPGEYMMDAETVSALGDGSTEAGAAKLDQMREGLRAHKRAAPKGNIPPRAMSPLQYMKGRVK